MRTAVLGVTVVFLEPRQLPPHLADHALWSPPYLDEARQADSHAELSGHTLLRSADNMGPSQTFTAVAAAGVAAVAVVVAGPVAAVVVVAGPVAAEVTHGRQAQGISMLGGSCGSRRWHHGRQAHRHGMFGQHLQLVPNARPRATQIQESIDPPHPHHSAGRTSQSAWGQLRICQRITDKMC